MQKAVGCGVKLVVFSDLDGTFLSPEDYNPGPARGALKICQGEGIPVVFVSSKTRAEIEKLRQELGDSNPFISENGGAVFLPKTNWERPAGWLELDDYWCLALGESHPLLCSALKDAAGAAGARILGFSAMPVSQVAEMTGLPEKDAELARMREFDEPFVILNESKDVISRLQKEINARGFHYTRGGVFHHITGGCDKGKAVRRLMNLYRRANPGIRFAAVGDAANDLPMLRAVDQPFLVRKSGGLFEEGACFNGLTLTEGIGPLGFAEAINLLRKSVK
jgi:mannosyl-3-phosphoglycerate phosphatase